MRTSQTPKVPGHPFQIVLLPELVELHLDGGIEQAQLYEKLVSHGRRFRKTQNGREEVRQIKIEVPKRLDELMDGRRLGIGQIDLAVQLLAEGAPVEFHEGMFPGNFTDDVIGDAGSLAEPSQVNLAHFSAAAHIVHQVVGVPFAANKGHSPSPANPAGGLEELPTVCSVRVFHYRRQAGKARSSKRFGLHFFAAPDWIFRSHLLPIALLDSFGPLSASLPSVIPS